MMRRMILPAAILTIGIAALFAGTSCRREHLPPERLVGKLVITGPCENYAIQLISGNIDSSKIMALWRNGDSTYTNVFSVSNRCTFARYGLKRGDKFSFLLNDSLDVQTCMQCEIYIALPPVWNTVTGVEPIP